MRTLLRLLALALIVSSGLSQRPVRSPRPPPSAPSPAPPEPPSPFLPPWPPSPLPPRPPPPPSFMWSTSTSDCGDPDGTSTRQGAARNAVGPPSPRQLAMVARGTCAPAAKIAWTPPSTTRSCYLDSFFNTTGRGATPVFVRQVANVTILLLSKGSARPVIDIIAARVQDPSGNETLFQIFRATGATDSELQLTCPGLNRWRFGLLRNMSVPTWWPDGRVLGVRVTVRGPGIAGTGVTLPSLGAVGLDLQ